MESTYQAFFNGKTVELTASSLYAAKLKAVAHFKPRKSQEHMVTVILTQRADGTAVQHVPDF